MTKYHTPVLLNECLEGLNIKPEGIYVDVTYGAGGHSKPILKRLNAKGHLYGFDKDEDVRRNLEDDENFTFIHSDFRFIDKFLRYYGADKIDGVLADLGVSSHQLDDHSRGFGYKTSGQLDMRMNKQSKLTASHVINNYEEVLLAEIFSSYGEVRNSKTLARKISERRRIKHFTEIEDFIDFLRVVSIGSKPRYLAQVFQAIRIEVNDEFGALVKMLESVTSSLVPGGRLVVISYHSLEDRIIKRFMKTGNVKGEFIFNEYGHRLVTFDLINKKVIVPQEEELLANPRSRSAKLRIAAKRM